MFSRRLSPGGAQHSWVQLDFERLVVSQHCQQLVAALLDVTAILFQCCALSWSGEYGLRPVHSMSVTGIATDVFLSSVDHNRSHNYWIPKARPPRLGLHGERAHCYLWLWQWRNAKRWYVLLPFCSARAAEPVPMQWQRSLASLTASLSGSALLCTASVCALQSRQCSQSLNALSASHRSSLCL